MAGVTTPSQPRNIPRAGLTASTPGHLSIPSPGRSFRPPHLASEPFSPVTQEGSFEFDRIVKQGQVHKRTRKTKSWKPIYMVLRPHLLSIYRDKSEAKLRHQINLADLTAVARQNDPKRKEKYVFGLFSPSRNFHLEAASDEDAHDWVENIRREARIDEEEEEMYLASPTGGHPSPYQGFGRSIDAQIQHHEHHHPGVQARYSSSDMEGPPTLGSLSLPRTRGDRPAAPSRPSHAARQSSYADFSGPEHGSLSDFSDSNLPAARLSTLSLAPTAADGRPSTSSMAPPPHLQPVASHTSARPSFSTRSASQMSVNILGPSGALSSEDVRRGGPGAAAAAQAAAAAEQEERVVYHGWTYLLKSKSGVRQWKKTWLVLRSRGLALYKNEEEYAATLVVPLKDLIDAVEIDPVSRSKVYCMQLITEDRNYRFCAPDEESLTKCLGALKSLLAKRNARRKEREGGGGAGP